MQMENVQNAIVNTTYKMAYAIHSHLFVLDIHKLLNFVYNVPETSHFLEYNANVTQILNFYWINTVSDYLPIVCKLAPLISNVLGALNNTN